MKATNWIDSEKTKPNNGDKIIVQCAVGLYWGIYMNDFVLIENKKTDLVKWDDIDEWIIYPNR